MLDRGCFATDQCTTTRLTVTLQQSADAEQHQSSAHHHEIHLLYSCLLCVPFRSGKRSHHWPSPAMAPLASPRPPSSCSYSPSSSQRQASPRTPTSTAGTSVRPGLFTVLGCGSPSEDSARPSSKNASADLSELLAAIPAVAAPRGLRRAVPGGASVRGVCVSEETDADRR
jgi:hypothetical protein